ncbi:hypothetical protein D3C80_1156530 [compost metagenome]
MAGGHALDGLPGAEEAAHHIGPQDPLQPGHVHVFQAHLAFQHAGVVDQHVQASELPVQVFEHAQHLRFIAHVGAKGQGATAAGLDLAHQRLGRLPLLAVVDAQGVAALRRQAGGGSADAAAGTGDEHDFLHGVSSGA